VKTRKNYTHILAFLKGDSMSYINERLSRNSEIEHFLLSEGFEYGTGALGEGKMYYVVGNDSYNVWFALCKDQISLYAEYGCGGEVGREEIKFKENDFDSFLEAYSNSIDWAEIFVKPE